METPICYPDREGGREGELSFREIDWNNIPPRLAVLFTPISIHPFIPIDFRKSVFAQSWDNNDCATGNDGGKKEYRLPEPLPGWIIGKMLFSLLIGNNGNKNYNDLDRFFLLLSPSVYALSLVIELITRETFNVKQHARTLTLDSIQISPDNSKFFQSHSDVKTVPKKEKVTTKEKREQRGEKKDSAWMYRFINQTTKTKRA